MGAGAGGYVKITLQTLLSSYDPETDQLHRISELLFTGAPIPNDPMHRPPPDITTAHPGPPPSTQPVGKLGLGGLRPRDVLRFNLFARMDDDKLAGMGVAQDPAITDELEDAFGGKWAGFKVALAPA